MRTRHEQTSPRWQVVDGTLSSPVAPAGEPAESRVAEQGGGVPGVEKRQGVWVELSIQQVCGVGLGVMEHTTLHDLFRPLCLVQTVS